MSDAPDGPTIAAMMQDAAAIEFTGAPNGTVVDQAGEPMSGATIRLGREEARPRLGRQCTGRGIQMASEPPRCRGRLPLLHPERSRTITMPWSNDL